MKSVCLISLPSPFLVNDLDYVDLGVLYLSTYLKGQGISDVQVVDLATNDPIPRVDAEIIGISSTTPQFPEAVKVLITLKETNPDAVYVIGGPHATCHAQSCLDAGFDIVVEGEGEQALHKIVQKRVLRRTVMRTELLDDINFLPDREAIDMSRYGYNLFGKRATNVMTSRGCVFQCAFCCKTWGNTIRYVSPLLVAEEIKMLRDKYGFEGIVFFDDELNYNISHLHDLCECIKPLNMTWRCLLRAKPLNTSILQYMKDSGCVEIQIGVESGSDTILKTIRKGVTVKENIQAILMINELGIRVKPLLMIGNPGESRQTIEETRQFLHYIKGINQDINFSLMTFTPYPLSDIWTNMDKYDIWFDKDRIDFSKSVYKQANPLDPSSWICLVQTSNLSSADLINLQRDILDEFDEWGVKLARDAA